MQSPTWREPSDLTGDDSSLSRLQDGEETDEAESEMMEYDYCETDNDEEMPESSDDEKDSHGGELSQEGTKKHQTNADIEGYEGEDEEDSKHSALSSPTRRMAASAFGNSAESLSTQTSGPYVPFRDAREHETLNGHVAGSPLQPASTPVETSGHRVPPPFPYADSINWGNLCLLADVSANVSNATPPPTSQDDSQEGSVATGEWSDGSPSAYKLQLPVPNVHSARQPPARPASCPEPTEADVRAQWIALEDWLRDNWSASSMTSLDHAGDDASTSNDEVLIEPYDAPMMAEEAAAAFQRVHVVGRDIRPRDVGLSSVSSDDEELSGYKSMASRVDKEKGRADAGPTSSALPLLDNSPPTAAQPLHSIRSPLPWTMYYDADFLQTACNNPSQAVLNDQLRRGYRRAYNEQGTIPPPARIHNADRAYSLRNPFTGATQIEHGAPRYPQEVYGPGTSNFFRDPRAPHQIPFPESQQLIFPIAEEAARMLYEHGHCYNVTPTAAHEIREHFIARIKELLRCANERGRLEFLDHERLRLPPAFDYRAIVQHFRLFLPTRFGNAYLHPWERVKTEQCSRLFQHLIRTEGADLQHLVDECQYILDFAPFDGGATIHGLRLCGLLGYVGETTTRVAHVGEDF